LYEPRAIVDYQEILMVINIPEVCYSALHHVLRGMSDNITPKVRAEWLEHLLSVWEVTGSNLGQQIGYPDQRFHSFT
jgi:hypothetical protein